MATTMAKKQRKDAGNKVEKRSPQKNRQWEGFSERRRLASGVRMDVGRGERKRGFGAGGKTQPFEKIVPGRLGGYDVCGG